jgi:hypothetical protein
MGTLVLVVGCVCGYFLLMTVCALAFRKHMDQPWSDTDGEHGLSDAGSVIMGFFWPVTGTISILVFAVMGLGWVAGKYVRFIGKAGKK